MSTTNDSRSGSSRWMIVIACVVTGIIFGVSLAAVGVSKQGATTRFHSVASVWVDRPTSLAELVAPARLIVTGELGSVVQQTSFAGYDQYGNLLPVVTVTSQSPSSITTPVPTAHPPVEFPLSDQEIVNVNQVVRDCDGVVPSSTPKVRSIALPPATEDLVVDNSSEFPYGEEGDYRLFFLSKEPDGVTYGLAYGPCSRLVLDSDIVTCSDGDRTSLAFMDGLSASQFIEAVATEAASQGCP